MILEGADEAGVKAPAANDFSEMTVTEHVEYYISEGMSKMDAIKKVARDRGVPKSEIYNEVSKNS